MKPLEKDVCRTKKREKSTTNVPLARHGEMSQECASVVSFVVLGQLYSMKNTRQTAHIKNRKALAFERDFAYQVKPEHRKNLGSLTEPLRAIVTVFYPSRRQDLDCALLYDCLQANGIVANDRYIIEKHEFAEVDPKNPRVEITVEEI